MFDKQKRVTDGELMLRVAKGDKSAKEELELRWQHNREKQAKLRI